METIRTLAKKSGVPYSRIRQWIAEGRLPYVMSGNRFLINVEIYRTLLGGDISAGQQTEA